MHPQPHASQGTQHQPWEHLAFRGISYAGIGASLMALAPVLGPILIPTGDIKLAAVSAISFCSTGASTGLAATVAQGLSGVPLIGASLAAGGLPAVLICGSLALGGMWLGNVLDRQTSPRAFRYGALIRWTSLATSMLFALPTVLPALSMGLMFFGSLFSQSWLIQSALGIGSLGAAGATSAFASTAGGLALTAAHALGCILPLASAGLLMDKREVPRVSIVLPGIHEAMLRMPTARADARVTEGHYQ